MSAHIYTKQIRDKWRCLGTIQGYDYSFVGLTVRSAQIQMMYQLLKLKEPDCNWHPIEENKVVRVFEFKPRVFHRPRLDHL